MSSPLPTSPGPDSRLRASWQRATRFKEHLSTLSLPARSSSRGNTPYASSDVLPLDSEYEPKSHFSPDSSARSLASPATMREMSSPPRAAFPHWSTSTRASQRDVERAESYRKLAGTTDARSAPLRGMGTRMSRMVYHALHRKPAPPISPTRSFMLSPQLGHVELGSVPATPKHYSLHPWRALSIKKQGRGLRPLRLPANQFVLEVPNKKKRKIQATPRQRYWARWCIVITLLLVIIFVILAVVLGRQAQTVNTSPAATAPVELPAVTYTVTPSPVPITFATTIGTTVFTTATTVSQTPIATTSTASTASTASTTSTSSSAAPSATLSPALQSCLSQFTLNAPSDPQGYPCSTCTPLLQTLPNDLALGSSTPSGAVTGQGVALQFCALQSIFNAAAPGNTSSNPLSSAGWMVNASPCEWSGISCDSAGRVTGLSLSFPGVPAALPDTMSGLVGLQTFDVTGNNAVPAGPLPPSLLNISSLTTLQLQNTALTTLPDNTFTELKNLQHVVLVSNAHLGAAIPSSVEALSLQSLIINNQGLQGAILENLLTSTSLASSLQTLDLSSNAITGPLPEELQLFTTLLELNLSSNNLTSLASALPPSIQTLSLASNPQLTGTMPASVCGSTKLTSCDLRATELTGTGSGNTTTCGQCLFH